MKNIKEFPLDVEYYLKSKCQSKAEECDLIEIFNREAFKAIKSEDAKDFIKRLLTPNYKKPWNNEEFSEEAED